jgi:PAS domain S-box-containing protein
MAMGPELYRQIIEASPDAVITIDAEERVLGWNARAETLFGWTEAEMAGRPLAERILPSRFRDDFERAMYHNLGGRRRAALAGRRSDHRIELRVRRRDGGEFPIDLAVAPFRAGGEWRFTAFIRDLSDQQGRIARAAIDSQISRLLGSSGDRELVERRILDIVCAADGWDFGSFWRYHDHHLACVAIQQGAMDACAGFRDASLAFRPARGQGLPGRILEEGHPRWFKDLAEEGRAGRGDALREAGFRSAFGFPIRLGPRDFGVCEFLCREAREPDPGLLDTMAALSGPIALFFRQKESEAALRESEERFRLLIENSNDGISVRDRLGFIIYNSPATERLSGYAHDEVIGMRAMDLIHPDDLAAFHDSMEPIYAAAGARTSVIFRIRHKDGSWRWLESRATNLLEDPRIGGILSNFRDITEEHEAKLERERLLARLEGETQRLSRLLDLLPIPVLLEEPGTGALRFANQAAIRLAKEAAGSAGTGSPAGPDAPGAAAPPAVLRFTDPEGNPLAEADAPGARAARGETLVNLEACVGEPAARRSLLVNSATMAGANGLPGTVVLACLDVTALKQVEAQLRQSQRLEAVGQLAGGIAHDFNNLLTVINGFASLAADKAGEDSPLAPILKEVVKGGERAYALTNQLLTFSRKKPMETRLCDLNAILADMEPMLRRLIGDKIRIETRAHPGPVPIRVDRSQVEQVIMNLAINARDAMPEGGILALETGRAAEPLRGAVLKEEGAGPYAVLTVSDTGTGMPPEVQARIFEPLFTTKPSGKGTGLGLSVVFGVARQCHGGIALESSPGQGSRFSISFPIDPATAAKEREERRAAEREHVPPRADEEIAELLGSSAP